MVSRPAGRWFGFVPALAPMFFAAALGCSVWAGEPSGEPPDAPENFPGLDSIRAKAEAGKPKSQTKLGDFHMAQMDFTNAAIWYRKAAEQGEVEAQLALASCYMAGRGLAKNPQEAARWLRQAATQIGGPPTNAAPPQAVPPVPLQVARVTNTAPTVVASVAPVLPVPPPAPAPPPTNLARVSRVRSLLYIEPRTQEPPDRRAHV